MKILAQLDKLSNNAKVVFLLDAIGALLSALFIFIILTYFENQIGIPAKTLIFLFIIAIVLSIFSFCCYLIQNNNLKQNLKVISTANIIYCILTIITLFAYRQVITKLGLVYFIVEIFIIILIVKLELKTINKLNDKWANG
jgi:drug/metabolite transporter (DMT)-like permease